MLFAAFLDIFLSAAAARPRQVFEVFGRAPADVMNQCCEYIISSRPWEWAKQPTAPRRGPVFR
jgi:hypothetical protein